MNTLCNFCRQLVGTFSKFFSIMEWLMIRVWVAANLFHHQCTSTRNCLKDLVLRIVRKLWQPLFGFFMQNNHCDVPIGWSCLSNWQPGAPSNMHTYVCAHTHTQTHTTELRSSYLEHLKSSKGRLLYENDNAPSCPILVNGLHRPLNLIHPVQLVRGVVSWNGRGLEQALPHQHPSVLPQQVGAFQFRGRPMVRPEEAPVGLAFIMSILVRWQGKGKYFY